MRARWSSSTARIRKLELEETPDVPPPPDVPEPEPEPASGGMWDGYR